MVDIARVTTFPDGIGFIDDECGIFFGTTAPNSGGGEAAPVSSIFIEKPVAGEPKIWVKTGSGNTDWKYLGIASWVSTSSPTADNDDSDTAALGRTFAAGDTWVNTTDESFWICYDSSTGAAVWQTAAMAPGISIYNGIDDPSKYTITYNATNRQFTVTNSGAFVAVGGTVVTPANETTVAHADTTDQYWAVYTQGSTTLTVTTTPDIGTQAVVGRVLYNTDQTSPKAIEFEERHTQQYSEKLHENQHQTVGAKLVTSPLGCALADYVLQDSSSDASVTFSTSAGEMYDEDIEQVIAALASGTYSILYRAGTDASDRMDWDDAATVPYKVGGTYPTYNQLSGGSWVQTELSSDQRMNMFIFGWTRKDINRQIVLIQGQSVFATTNAADTEGPGDLQLASYLAPEQVPLYRVTIRCRTNYTGTTGNARIERITDFRGTVTGAQVVSGSATDHQTLSNRDATGAHPAASIETDTTDFEGPLTPTETDVQLSLVEIGKWIPPKDSGTLLTGFTISDGGGGTIDIASGTAEMKTSDSDTASLVRVSYAGTTGFALTDNNLSYVYFDYNAGTPIIAASTDPFTMNLTTQIPVGTVYRHGTTIHISNVPANWTNIDIKSAWRLFELYGRQRASGMITTETGTRNLSITSGVVYFAHWRMTTNALDTSAADTFRYWYNDGSWQTNTGQTQISNTQYNDYGTGLATLSNNKFGVHWVYQSNASILHVVYGQGDYTESEAYAADVPANMPDEVIKTGILIAKIIIEKSDTSFTTILYPWTTAITLSGGGGASSASAVSTITTNFDKNLSTADTNVQLALDTLNDFPWVTTTDFNTTPPSTSTITMTSDLTSRIKVGTPIQYQQGGTWYFAACTAITSGLLTITGPALSTGAASLQGLRFDIMRSVERDSLFVPGNYNDATDDNLLANDTRSPERWRGRTAYVVGLGVSHSSPDSGAEPIVNMEVANAAVSTENTNDGIQLSVSADTWVSGAVATINSSNYQLSDGDEMEVACKDDGGNNDARDLTLEYLYVYE